MQSFSTSHAGCGALLLGVSLFLPAAALADGKVFPPKAYPAGVRIPDQSAVLIWSNGIERLVIETRFVGEGTNFAWVVPFPAQPVIEPATTGLFTTLRFRFQPEIKHHVPALWGAALLLGGLGWLLLTVRQVTRVSLSDVAGCLAASVGAGATLDALNAPVTVGLTALGVTFFTTLAVRRGTSPVYTILVSFFVLMLLWSMLLPSLGKAKAKAGIPGEANGITVLARETVGVYDTTTVAASDPAALPRWLEENGFALTPGSQPVIEQYAREGWVFVAAKMRRESGDARVSSAHPLSFTFPAEHPVYPLRLTGVGNDRVTVELYVFGPERAECAGFKVAECHIPQWPQRVSGRAASDPALMGHPLLKRWAATSEVVTKLSGTLGPRDMEQDAIVAWESFRPHRSALYSRQGARTIGLNFGLPLAAALALLAAARCRLRDQPLGSITRPLVWAAGLGVGVSVLVYAALPKIEVRLEKRYGWVRNDTVLKLLAWHIQDELPPGDPLDATSLRRAFHRIPEEDRTQQFRNELLGGLIMEEDSPGNFTLRETAAGVELIAHDVMGGEEVVDVFER